VCVYPSNKHNCKHKKVAIRICPADALNVAVLGVSVSLSDDGKVLSNTGLSKGPDMYASVVAEVGSVAAVIVTVTDVFYCLNYWHDIKEILKFILEHRLHLELPSSSFVEEVSEYCPQITRLSSLQLHSFSFSSVLHSTHSIICRIVTPLKM